MKPWVWDYDLPDDWEPKTDDEDDLANLKPYLLETDPHEQEEFLHNVKYFFLDQGKEFLSRNLD